VLPAKKSQRFCDRPCSIAYRRAQSNHQITDHCLNCQATLSHKPFNKFCSQSCAATYNNSRRDSQVRVKQRATLMSTLERQGLVRTDEKEIYKVACSFKFNIFQYPEIPGYNMLLEQGVFNSRTKKHGVVRDHIVSKEFGWRNQVPPEIISHPANCQFISNEDNIKKSANCDMSLEELLVRIKIWEETHTLPPLDQLPEGRPSKKSPSATNLNQEVPRGSVFQWILENKTTHERVEVTHIVHWLKRNRYSTSAVYGPNAKWTIVKKINLKTKERLI